MTVREALDQIKDKVRLQTRLEAQRDGEDDPVMRKHINMWIDEVSHQIDTLEDAISDEIGRLQEGLAERDSSATLLDMGRGRNLSEFT